MHAGGVILQLEVGEFLQLREFDHAVHTLTRLTWRQAQHQRVEDDVVPCSQVGIEPYAELDEGGEPPVDVDASGVSAVNARQALQQRALAGAVTPDDPEELPGL